TYTVLATFNGTRIGGYSVSLRTSDPPQCAAGDLVLGATREGEIAAGDCRVRDHAPGTTDTSLADAYRLSVAERGVVSIEMRSTAFAPGVVLLDAAGRRLAAGSGLDVVRIAGTIEPGTYIVLATAIGALTGPYTLRAILE
ncbi:MAG: hypothetical protein ACRD96_28945, partial [Bryobacteraceae bacterium]